MENETIFTNTNIFCFTVGAIVGVLVMLLWNYSLFSDDE